MSLFAPCLAYTLSEEGGWSDNPADPGGATMKGVTLAVFRDWHDNPRLGPADLHAITTDDLTALYAARYYNPVQGPALPAGVDLSVWDMGVNAGVGRSSRMLQQLVGEKPDGWIGPATLAAVARLDTTRAMAMAQRWSPEAARTLQGAIGQRQDGMVGRLTLMALTSHPHGPLLALLGALHDAQAAFYKGLANPAFEHGWLARVERRLAAAVKLAG